MLGTEEREETRGAALDVAAVPQDTDVSEPGLLRGQPSGLRKLMQGRFVPACMSGRTHAAPRMPSLGTIDEHPGPEHGKPGQRTPIPAKYKRFVHGSESFNVHLSAQRYRWPGLKPYSAPYFSKTGGPARSLCRSGSGSSSGGAAAARERELKGGGGARLLMRIAMEYCKHGAVLVMCVRCRQNR